MNKDSTYYKKKNRYTLVYFCTYTNWSIVRRQWPGILNGCKKYDVNLLSINGGILRKDVSLSQPNVMFDLLDVEKVDGILC